MADIPPYVITIIVSLVVAQGIKYLILVVKKGSFDHLRQLYLPGNMPSAHSTSVTALLVHIGLREGIESGLFGVAFLLAVIVIYDTVMVRRSVGEQGIAIYALIKMANSKVPFPHASLGHTPIELLAGIVLGATIGSVVFSATY